MPDATAREHDVRLDAIAKLIATNAFDDVYAYSAPEDRGQKAGELRAAVVAPINGDSSVEWDDMTTGRPLCKMTFNVTVIARHDDPETRDGTADLLLSVVRNALNGKSLAGLTFPQTTLVKGPTWLPEKSAERQVRCVVQTSYEAPAWNAFNTSE
jgi:hypothetical protein